MALASVTLTSRLLLCLQTWQTPAVRGFCWGQPGMATPINFLKLSPPLPAQGLLLFPFLFYFSPLWSLPQPTSVLNPVVAQERPEAVFCLRVPLGDRKLETKYFLHLKHPLPLFQAVSGAASRTIQKGSLLRVPDVWSKVRPQLPDTPISKDSGCLVKSEIPVL